MRGSSLRFRSATSLVLGATLINRSTWERIPADLRPALLEAARTAGTRLQAEIRQSGDRDVEAMRKRGLNVVAVDGKTRALWQRTAEGLYPTVRGAIVPADAFDEALRLRDEYRRNGPPPGATSPR